MDDTDTSAFQTAFARLLTDPRAIERFYADPACFAEENALNTGQMSALQSLDKSRLYWVSASLGVKRFFLIEPYFPATFALLRRHRLLAEVERSLLATYRPIKSERLSRALRDAYWFAELIERQVDQGELDVPHLIDVLRCERAEFVLWNEDACRESANDFKARNASRSSVTHEELLDGAVQVGRHVVVHEFACDVLPFVQTLVQGTGTLAPNSTPTLILFGRVPGTDRIQKARVARMMRWFLLRADGRKSTRAILAELLDTHTVRAERESIEHNCCQMLQKLRGQHFVTLEEGVGASARSGGPDDAGQPSLA